LGPLTQVREIGIINIFHFKKAISGHAQKAQAYTAMQVKSEINVFK
jgi:hypothetical protein